MDDINAESFLPDNPLRSGEASPSPSPDRDVMRSVTRLIIGGLEVGLDEFLRLLSEWEEKAAAQTAKPPAAAGEQILEAGEEYVPPGGSSEDLSQITSSERDYLRWALIGMVFEMQAGVRKSAVRLQQVERAAIRFARPFFRPAQAMTSRLLPAPVRRRWHEWTNRGEHEVARWIELGRAEEERSRSLAGAAFNLTVDEYIEYLTNNPQVQELVQQQSTGLATEMIEEVRERTVSADTFLEGLARSLLRRAPRAALPQPPEPVRQSAISLRRVKQGVVKQDVQRGAR